MKKRTGFLLLTALMLMSAASCAGNENQNAGNVIILIGDGMSFAHFHAGMLASETPLNIEKMRHIGFIRTSSANDFITDSGAAGTAIATGVKTNNGYIGMDPEGQPLSSILHIAGENGLATGIVVTCAVTHATPAAFIARQISRNMTEEIALDYLKTDIDLFIGGGRNYFENRNDGRNLVAELEEKGYRVAYTMDEVRQATSGRLAGLVAGGHPPKYSENRGDMLPDGVETALNILSRHPEGFFLMVEGAQIDWGGHDNDIDYIVAEMLDFDRAVGKALEFAEKDGNTLVVVTSDHDTGGMALHGFDPGTGEITAGFTTGGHTGLIQPVFAFGPGSEAFTGVYENTGVFDRMLKVFGFSRN